jgi:hypothetical protein
MGLTTAMPLEIRTKGMPKNEDSIRGTSPYPFSHLWVSLVISDDSLQPVANLLPATGLEGKL